jgi:hypothetical protein
MIAMSTQLKNTPPTLESTENPPLVSDESCVVITDCIFPALSLMKERV